MPPNGDGNLAGMNIYFYALFCLSVTYISCLFSFIVDFYTESNTFTGDKVDVLIDKVEIAEDESLVTR